MANENPIFQQLVNAISPIISIGVGSAIHTVCSRQGLKVEALSSKDLPVIKRELMAHYEKFWAQKITDVRLAIEKVH